VDDEAQPPAHFDFDAYMRNGAFEYVDPDAKAVRLVARFAADAALHLEETPLSRDQAISPCEDGWVELCATVKLSLQLQWWLLGFGPLVEVLEPTELRKTIAESVKTAAKRYPDLVN